MWFHILGKACGKSLWFLEISLAYVPRPPDRIRGAVRAPHTQRVLAVLALPWVWWGRFNGWVSVVLMTESFLLQHFNLCCFMTFQLNSSSTSGVQYIKHIRNLLHYCFRPTEALTPHVYWTFQLRPCWWKDLTAEKLLDVQWKTQTLHC